MMELENMSLNELVVLARRLQSELTAERAAKAQGAPAALSYAQILKIASETGMFEQHDNATPSADTVTGFALEILAAAGNSQDAKDAEEQAQGEGWLRAMSDISVLLPSTYYMDPPDGGSATVTEQVRRMAKDAARYRWLRGDEWGSEIYDAIAFGEPNDFDATIDAAMAAAPSPAEGA